MEVTPHFEDIRKVLKRDLKRAKFSIYAAIGWLTDPSLINDLSTTISTLSPSFAFVVKSLIKLGSVNHPIAA